MAPVHFTFGLAFLALVLVTSCQAKIQAPKRPYITTADNVNLTQRQDPSRKQKLQCYERRNFRGDSVRLIDYVHDLYEYNFDNRASSCCFKGIWLLYDNINFNSNSPQSPMYAGWGEHYCVNFGFSFSLRASSVRFVGAPEDYRLDTLNFYEHSYFGGDEQFFYRNSNRVPRNNFGNSMIVTGCQPWTLYEFPNYAGYSVCVYPSDVSNCSPGFFPSRKYMGGMERAVSSVRKGCFSRNIIKGESLRSGISPRKHGIIEYLGVQDEKN